MATYFLSGNPTISNFRLTSQNGQEVDQFVVNTGPAASVLISQQGTSVVITNGTNTATIQNFSLDQMTSFQFQASDGSTILVGDNTTAFNQNSADIYSPGALALGQTGGTTTTGADYIFGLGGNDQVLSVVGNDRIFLNQGDDTVTFGDGAAVPATAAGNATVYGGQGADTVNLALSSGNSLIFGNIGADTITGAATTSGNNTVFGGQDTDTINFTGATGNNQLFGDQGSDQITGGTGNDSLFGGDGDDILTDAGGNNQYYGNQGRDTINVSGAADTAFGGQGRDTITATAATAGTLLFGNMDSDTITGSAQADTIFGGQGNDRIISGGGADVLSGDLGNDFFDYSAGGAGGTGVVDNTGNANGQVDQIAGFVSGQDRIATATAGTAANYTEIQSSTVTDVTTALAAAAAVPGGQPLYTFVAGASNGYLVINQAGNAGVIQLNGLTSTTQFDSSDITTIPAVFPA